MRLGKVVLTLGLGAAGVVLVGCGSDQADGLASSSDAYDAIAGLGVDCADPLIGGGANLPYTSVSCVGLQIDWMDDADGYADLVRADCEATPADARGRLADMPLVVGDRWVLRGTDPDRPGSWPRAVTPGAAATELSGSASTMADYCRSVGAWS